MQYLIGVSFGGTAAKATLLSGNGDIVATSTEAYSTHYPQNGWAEQNPDDSYRAFVRNIRRLLEQSGVNPEEIAGLSVDAATHTSVLLDKDDKVIREAIYWTDKRSTAETDWLLENYQQKIYKMCHNTPNAMWTLPQIMWVRKHEPENFSRINKIMFMKDYVRYRLTGDFVTDYIEAMGSMFMDVPENCWSKELCDLAGIEISMLPKIVSPTDIISPLRTSVCAETGLAPKTKVIAGATDTALEVYANGAITPGQMTVKLATSGRICPITRDALENPLLVNYKHVIPGLWYPGTGTKSCATSNQWYRDTFCAAEAAEGQRRGVDPYVVMDDTAAAIAPGSDNLFFHPYLQGELTPYFDSALRASFVGACSHHTKAHFNRAVLEGVGYSMKDCYNVVKTMNLDIRQASIIGGGAKSAVWSQIVCDMLGIELMQTKNNDSSLGSAMMAGVAIGVFESFADSVEKCVKIRRIIKPNPETNAFYEKGYQTYKRIHDALAPIYQDMQ